MCTCKKRLVNKLVEECTQNIEETKLVEKIQLQYINTVLALCTFYFQYFLQLPLELVAIFFVFIGT